MYFKIENNTFGSFSPASAPPPIPLNNTEKKKKKQKKEKTEEKATNGYQKFPNGLILQWGYIADQGIKATTYFPITFSKECLCVFVQRVQGNIETSTEIVYAGASGSLGATNVFETTKTYFKVDSAYNDPDKSAVFWMAIGY